MKSQRPQDPPLIVRAIRRVRKGVYECRITHESGHFFGYEKVNAADKASALTALRRIWPSATLPPKPTPKSKKVLTGLLTEELKELQVAIAIVDYNSGE